MVFDWLIFPYVYVPDGGIDLDATAKELERIRALPSGRHLHEENHIHMLNLMVLALNAEHLKDFCVFTGDPQWGGATEPGAKELAFELERAIYGPPPKNFIPTISDGFAKGLPGGPKAAVNGPGWITYPANALLYASRNGYVLVNDDPNLPMPGVGGADVKANAKQLATMMALESVSFVLPNIRPLSLPELAEFRSETKDLVRPFRRAMLRLSKDLNAAILSDASLSDVKREARFIAETTVAPELEQLKAELARPSQPWYRRVVDLATAAPSIAGAFATMPTSLAIAKALA
ncbi:MAG TPA: hypothetical protein VEV37_02755, partial [Bryobacteraceae bacterium]|nr:hypothetical protein [Bryobacteraceae bacterium]